MGGEEIRKGRAVTVVRVWKDIIFPSTIVTSPHKVRIKLLPHLSLVMTAPFLPMILGWYSGATDTLTMKLLLILSSFSASSSATFSPSPIFAASTLVGTPEIRIRSDLASTLGTRMLTSKLFIISLTPTPFWPMMNLQQKVLNRLQRCK